jgi:SnoaL-like domain
MFASHLELPEPGKGDRAFSAAKARIIAYWADECARDLDRLMAHFTGDGEVGTPEGTFRGRDDVAALYRKSFESFPELKVDVKAGFLGRDAYCFEYSAVLSDPAENHWLVEGINLMRLQDGLICSLRSFEDAPRRLSTQGKPNDQTAQLSSRGDAFVARGGTNDNHER